MTLKSLSILLILVLKFSINNNAKTSKVTLPPETKPKWEKQSTNNHDKFYLKKQALLYNYELCGYFNNLFNAPTIKSSTESMLKLYPDMEIRNCFFLQSEQTINHTYENCPSLNLKVCNTCALNIIENSFNEPLQVMGVSGTLNILGNASPYLMISRSYGGDLDIQGNTINEVAEIGQCQKNKLQLINNTFKNDTAQIIVNNSKINQLTIGEINSKHCLIKLYHDTISSFMLDQVMFTNKSKIGRIEELTFVDCYLNGDFITAFEKKASVKVIRFNSCTFSKDCKLFDLSADTVEFDNCINIEKQLYLSEDSTLKQIILKFYNTDVTNINFNYFGRFKLFEGSGPENVKSNYENLLAKFAQEHKKVSYENVDIAYSRYKYGKFISFLNWIWWDFGYNRWQIIWWTIFFLLIFTAINYYYWDKVYPLENQNDHTSVRKLFNVFVYTSLVFFSLRINFEQLSFKSPKWLFYFFIQYLIGLACLFFIANAILKFN